MQKLTTLSENVYTERKQKALNIKTVRKEITLAELKILSNTTIEIEGVAISMSKQAYKTILKRLRIPFSFAKRFVDEFGKDGLKTLVDRMKLRKSDLTVTLLVDPVEKRIISVLPAGYAAISNESFFGFIERYIDEYNLDVTHFGIGADGTVGINTLTKGNTLSIPGLPKEVFQTGLNFSNTPTKGLQVSPFLNRLICSNGWSSDLFSETYSMHKLHNYKIKEFNNKMLELSSTGFRPAGLVDKVKKAIDTPASLHELEAASGQMLNVKETIDWDYIQRYTPMDKAKEAYALHGKDISQFNNIQRKRAKAGISVWNLFNGITNFASNDQRYDLDDHSRSKLMISAGRLLMKKQYDTEGIVHVDPFATKDLLSENAIDLMEGNNN